MAGPCILPDSQFRLQAMETLDRKCGSGHVFSYFSYSLPQFSVPFPPLTGRKIEGNLEPRPSIS